jgi:enoyl-CoA hydratase
VNRPVTHERQNSVAVIRILDLNVTADTILVELANTLQRIQSDSSVRVILLTNADKKLGFGINALDPEDETARATVSSLNSICRQIESFEIPVLAAVNGVADGGGCELAFACHIRLASTDAEFRPLQSGSDLSSDKNLTGREAYDKGMVNRLVAADDLEIEARSLASEISELAPFSIRACIRAINQGLELPLERGLELESELFASLFATNDLREGTRAFLEKRSPKFTGS